MFIRQRRCKGSFGLGKGRNTGKVKVVVLLSLAALLLFLICTVDVRQTSATDCDCNVCHGDHHGPGWSGCSSCHDAPPQTGSHLKHYGSAPLLFMQYGDTGNTSVADAYKFGCGNCHPLDKTKHGDGIVQVELYNANSPADSMKAKNPSSAAYTPGTNITTYPSKVAGQSNFSYSDGSCSDLYCHSGYTVTSGPVGYPLKDAATGRYILDANCELTYAPYTVNYQRVYKATPAWGTAGSMATCTACHDFPLTTSDPSNAAGVGDSHQWIDSYGFGNLHGYNMGTENGPVLCRTCHYETVTEANTWSWSNTDVAVYGPVPLASRAVHVNGTPDVVFDTVHALNYYGKYSFTLSGATYNPSTKTCSNVACHYNPTVPAKYQQYQMNVRWGRPFRWYNTDSECDLCHRTMLPKSCP